MEDELHIDPTENPLKLIHDCQTLAALEQFYYPGIGIVCQQHNVPHIVPLEFWQIHMERLHSIYKTIGHHPDLLKQMEDHIRFTHQLATNSTDDVATSLPQDIPTALPTPKVPPQLHWGCPSSKCVGFWQPINSNNSKDVVYHIDQIHGYRKRLPIYQFIQKVFVYRYKSAVYHSFILPGDWNGDTMFPFTFKNHHVPSTIIRAAPANTNFIQEAGWPHYIDSLCAEPHKLTWLVELPSPRLVQIQITSDGEYIESGLLILHKANFTYLRSAIDYAFENHRDLRNLLVQT